MKYIVLVISLLFVACASKPKSGTSEAQKAETAKATVDAKPAKTEAKPAAQPATTSDHVTCTLGDIRREIKITRTAERCGVEYTKDGTTNEIASGGPGSPHCAEVLERVKNNLTAAGYKCE